MEERAVVICREAWKSVARKLIGNMEVSEIEISIEVENDTPEKILAWRREKTR